MQQSPTRAGPAGAVDFRPIGSGTGEHSSSPSSAANKFAEEMAAQHRAIIDSCDDAIISKTVEGIITSWNHGAEIMFGFSPAEAIGRPIQIIIPADRLDEENEILGRIQRAERIRQFETVRLRKDGTRICVSATITPIIGEGGRLIGISKIVRDITERLSLEAQFRQAQKMEAVGRLAGGVAHDFNNLLGIISGYCGLLLEEAPAGHPMRAYLVEIERAGQRAASLTRQLLAYGRKQFLAPEVINLNAVVIDCEKMLRRLLGEDIELATVSAPDKGWARVDVGQLEQALMNMAINARDAMPQGGKLTIETAPVMLDETYCQSRGDLKPGPHVMLAMTDSGSGMDAQTKAHIFEPFFTTKEVGKGSGLGLAMVFGFVQQSGGHIAVYSEPGLGSAFKLYFPAVAPACPVQKSAPVAEMALPGSETILLVEDELDLRKLTRQILSQHGYTVLEAGNGGEAVQLAASHAGRIDLLLSDVVMPVMGGRQLAAQLEALRPAIKVLFMSGYTDDAVMRHGVLASETAYIQKPFTVESLPLKVRKVLDEPGKPAGVTPAP